MKRPSMPPSKRRLRVTWTDGYETFTAFVEGDEEIAIMSRAFEALHHVQRVGFRAEAMARIEARIREDMGPLPKAPEGSGHA